MFNYIFLLKVPYLIYNLQAFSHNPQGFPGGSDGKESACSAGDPSAIPRLGRSPGEGNGNPLRYSYLDNSMDKGVWRATVHGVREESDTTEPLTPHFLPVSDLTFHIHNGVF